MNKRISFCIGSLSGGGAQKVCITLANGLSQLGYRVDLIVMNLTDAVWHAELSEKVNLINLQVRHSRSAFFALSKYIKTNRPVSILSFNRQLSVVLVIIRLLSGARFRLVSRNIIYLSVAENDKCGIWHGVVSKYLIKIFYPMSDLIIAQSESMKDDLINYLGIHEGKVSVINNPLSREIEVFSNDCDFSDLDKQDYLLCVGRLEKQKAFHYAIEAFSNVIRDNSRLRLKIIGKGSLKQSLMDLSVEFGVSDRVDFMGFQTDMAPYYFYARATMLTSIFEGFPNVLIESISLGTPVVAFDCTSGPSEIIQEGINGYLVELYNIKQLTVRLTVTLDKKWDTAAVKQTAERFSSSKIIIEYCHVLF